MRNAETNERCICRHSQHLSDPPPSTMPKPVKPASSSDDSSSDSEPEVKPVSKGKVASVRFGTLNLPPLSLTQSPLMLGPANGPIPSLAPPRHQTVIDCAIMSVSVLSMSFSPKT